MFRIYILQPILGSVLITNVMDLTARAVPLPNFWGQATIYLKATMATGLSCISSGQVSDIFPDFLATHCRVSLNRPMRDSLFMARLIGVLIPPPFGV